MQSKVLKLFYPLSDELFNDLVRLTVKLKMDWFYPKYRERKTIDYEDIEDLYHSWEYSWFKDNKPEYETKRIRKLFNIVRKIEDEIDCD